SSGVLVHHVIVSLAARSRRLGERPAVTAGASVIRGVWSSTRRPALLAVPVVALVGGALTAYGLDAVGQTVPGWRVVGIAGGAVLALAAVLARPVAGVCLARWRTTRQAVAEWEPRFAEVFTAKEGTPRIVDRTV